MSDKFTPGPWEVDHDEAIRIKTMDGTVAIVTHLNRLKRRSIYEVEANARLIAAAPKMFAALSIISPERLELLAEYFDAKYPNNHNAEVQNDLRKLAEAIRDVSMTRGDAELKDAMEGRR